MARIDKNGVGHISASEKLIKSEAFYGRTDLRSIVIPDSVTEIGYDAFSGCTGLTSIVVSGGNKVYDTRNGCNAIVETKKIGRASCRERV